MLAALEAFAAKHMIDPVLSRRMISAAEELTALILDRIRKEDKGAGKGISPGRLKAQHDEQPSESAESADNIQDGRLPAVEKERSSLGLELMLEYLEKESAADLQLSWSGPLYDPLAQEDDIGVKIVRHAADQLRHSYADGVNRIEGRITLPD